MSIQSNKELTAKLVADPAALYQAMREHMTELSQLYGRWAAILAAYEATLPQHVKDQMKVAEKENVQQTIQGIQAQTGGRAAPPSPVGARQPSPTAAAPQPTAVGDKQKLISDITAGMAEMLRAQGIELDAAGMERYLAGERDPALLIKKAPEATQAETAAASPSAADQALAQFFGPQGLFQRIFGEGWFLNSGGYLSPGNDLGVGDAVFGYNEVVNIAEPNAAKYYSGWSTGFYGVSNPAQRHFFINMPEFMTVIDLTNDGHRQFPNVRDRLHVIDLQAHREEFQTLDKLHPQRLSVYLAKTNRHLHNLELIQRKRAMDSLK